MAYTSFVGLIASQELLEGSLDDVQALPVSTSPAPIADGACLGFSNPCLEEVVMEQVDIPTDVTVKLNNLEANGGTAHPLWANMNIIVNKQDEPVKLTEKFLNNSIDSTVSSPVWLPSDIKSNILKAQVEAGHKITRDDLECGEKNALIEDTSARSFTVKVSNLLSQESADVMEIENPAQSFLLTSEATDSPRPEKAEFPSILTLPEETPSVKSTTAELDSLLASLTENLIDLTDVPPPVAGLEHSPQPQPRATLEDSASTDPPVTEQPSKIQDSIQSNDRILQLSARAMTSFKQPRRGNFREVPSYTTLTPRWIVPSAAVTNGPLGGESNLLTKVTHHTETFPVTVDSVDMLQAPARSASPVIPEKLPRPKCLLTTEL